MPSSLLTTVTAPVVYRVSMPPAGLRDHEFEIQMDVPALPTSHVAELVFPAWAPGSYMVRDFVRHVYRLTITDAGGRPLAHERVDKGRWRVTTRGQPFRVRYRVFAFEASVRTSFLDDSHGYWNGTSLFFFVEGATAHPCRVVVAPPAGQGWRVTTALPPVRGARNTFAAEDFDELCDAPFEVGRHQVHAFTVGRTRFELALYGRTNADPARLVDILARVVAATGKIFGGFPFPRYVFIVHALPVGSGGLEHRASVTMDIAGMSFEDRAGYARFADLAAHEFFHAWNVKRIRDGVLGPFDYTRENYTRLLWFHEGFTDYLANVLILRAGVTRERDFWRWIADDWQRYAGRPGRGETPLDELSFEAWIKQYKPAENHFNRTVSYYERGLWAGMALDLELRLRTGGARGLPEMFRILWDDFGRRGHPVTEDDVRDATARATAPGAGRAARKPARARPAWVDAFYDRYIHGTDELPLPELWRRAGLTLRARPEWDESDRPESDRDPVRSERARAWTGIALHPDRTAIKNVLPGSPAWRAGLTFNDEVVAVEGHRVTAATFAKRVGDLRPGDRARLAYFRRDVLREATLTIGESPERRHTLEPDPRAPATARAVRDGWLGGR